jgi:hypothetical protein
VRNLYRSMAFVRLLSVLVSLGHHHGPASC